MTAAAAPPAFIGSHRFGLLITALGVAVFIPDALAMRLAAPDPWALAVYRGAVGGGIMLLGTLAVYGRGLPRAIAALGPWGLLLAFLEGISTVLFVLSIAWTSVANAMLAFAATPMLAALLARLLLGERIPRATALAIAATAVGLAIVAAGAWGEGGASPLGVLAGFLAALNIAAFFVILRKLRAASAAPVIGPGWLLGALIALPFATFEPLTASQAGWTFVTAGMILPAAITLVSWGSRYIPAAEASMITLLEVVAGPLLVWAALGEFPGELTLVGGAVVLAALAAHSAWRLRAPGDPVPAA